jgi:AcrR family transcriptional regulator
LSPLNKVQLAQIRDERREQIKQAALKIFARRGFAGTKTSMIATEAGISEGLMYRYFKSKDELFVTLIQELTESAKEETVNIEQLPVSPYEQIKTLTQTMFDERNKFAFMFVLRVRKDSAVPPEIAKIIKESGDAVIERLIPVFIKGQQSGEFAAGDPRQLLNWYFQIVNSLLMSEAEQEEYSVPDAEVLMRILTK